MNETRLRPPSQTNMPRKPRKPVVRQAAPRGTKKKPASSNRYNWLFIGVEALGLLVSAVLAIMILLGYSANRFSGTGFFASLLPFAIGVLALIGAMAAFFAGWWRLRKWVQTKSLAWPAAFAVSVALSMSLVSTQDHVAQARSHFRTLVGGIEEAGRVTLAHQVYAAYRRYGSGALQRMIERSQAYDSVIVEAANAFDLDPALLQGVAATESSFLPRDSKDGGRGLFQITKIPQEVEVQARALLSEPALSPLNHRHNAFLAAATLKYYLAQMNGDLFLGLLAYNIGPANGGLRFIMQRYGASDFVTIQPYLQTLPRDYPIRVLSYALAFRLWQTEGVLPPYEEGENALRIQRIGIPGLQG